MNFQITWLHCAVRERMSSLGVEEDINFVMMFLNK